MAINNIETIVRQSIQLLRNELGKEWLSNRMFGVKLHKAVASRIEQISPMEGWYIAAEQPIRKIPFVDQGLLNMTVQEYINGPGMGLAMYNTELTRIVRLGSKIGDLIPDLVVKQPDGVLWVWDLTTQQSDHLVKTMLYAHVLTSLGQLTKIGETYWLQEGGF